MMKQFGHYQIISELGRGGMGVVLKAHEQSLNRYVAIKVLSQQLANDEQVRERFIREARAVAALNHPNVVQVYFAGEHEGQPFFSMEFVQGQSLSEYLKQHAPLAPREAAEILLQAARGLAAAHDKGIVHRDIKPANLMMTEDGTIKLTDFGIAMAEDQGPKLTSTGEFVGTPGYLSPEVCIGAVVDARTDIFSLGIVYFEMLAGTPPFTNPSPLGLMREVVEARIPDIGSINSEVDATSRELLTRMLQKEPQDRFESCHEIIQMLEEGLKQERFSPNRPLPNKDVTRIWSDDTTSDTRVAAATKPSAEAPPPPPAPSGPPADVAVNQAQSAPAATVQKPVAVSARGGRWLAVAMVLVFVGASAATLAFFPSLLPAPVQRLLSLDSTNAASNTPAVGEQGSEKPFLKKQAADSEPSPVPDSRPAIPVQEVTPTHPAESLAAVLPNAPPHRQESLKQEAVSTAATHRAAVEPTKSVALPSKRMQKPVSRPTPLQQAKRESLQRLASGRPRVVVLMAGEPPVLDALQEPLLELLQGRDVEIVDSALLDGAGPWLRNDHWDLKGLQKKALLEGVDLVLLATARFLGQETLNYYGQSSELLNSSVELKLLRTPDLRMLLPGKRFQVRYTSLNRDYQVREAFADVADAVEQSLGKALHAG